MALHGGFTLPGESGYEKLTLDLAQKWGADCIRDSDGTVLSDEILNSGIPIYSTICLVRSVNKWAKEHTDCLQRNFLISEPVLATSDTISIDPMKGYFTQQFIINPNDPVSLWQVFDRTENREVPASCWSWDGSTVTVKNAVPYHYYTVNFLATRIWEEISLYNHITNDWGDKEHLMAVEPRYPETQQAILSFLDEWLRDHTHTNVVRFTSMFYNFTWIWGNTREKRDIFSDWGSYDFTVNPVSLKEFEKKYGYAMTSEDFIRAGKHNPVHNPPTGKMKDWMEFTGEFVRSFGRQCVDITHKYGKKAYVFYDDTWVGIEPWSGKFGEFGFDGLIKCVFNAFEARLNAGVPVATHELRLHPYLFPTGLGGEPTFASGGHPEKDARRFWACVRRALLRVKIDRIGLGGYLSLTVPFPAFHDEIEHIADEFRLLKQLHEGGKPYSTGIRVAILHSWGSLRTWNCSGHMHEHPELPLNHIHESLAGLPIELKSISFEDVIENGVPADVDVIINAGREGDAWSGGDVWKDARLKANINAFVAKGGGLIGVKEPACVQGEMRAFAIADLLGVDLENGSTICAGKYGFTVKKDHFITADTPEAPEFHNVTRGVYALDGDTAVLAAHGGDIDVACKEFYDGRSVYLSGFTYNFADTRLFYRAILWAAKKEKEAETFLPDDIACECAYFDESNTLVIINSGDSDKTVSVNTPSGKKTASIEAGGIAFIK